MPWWIWVIAILLSVLIIFGIVRSRGSRSYLPRSQHRLKQAEQRATQMEESLERTGLPPKNIRHIEKKLLALVHAQKREPLAVPEMESHRDNYSQLIQFQWEKAKDLRETGGRHLNAISRAEDHFLYTSAEEIRSSMKESAEAYSGVGMADTTWEARRHLRIEQASLLLDPIHNQLERHESTSAHDILKAEEQLETLANDQLADPPSDASAGTILWTATIRFFNLNQEILRDLRTSQGTNVESLAVELAEVERILVSKT